MVLSNKRVVYDVVDDGVKIKLTGSFTYTDDGRITEFGGNFMSTSGEEFLGGFSYTEREGNLVNKSTNSVKLEQQDDCDQALDNVIDMIKTEMTKQ